MRRTFKNILVGAAIMTLLLVAVARPSLADCSADAEEVDARCYNGDVQAALRDALASDRPLLLPRGTYAISQPLVIDYAAQADTGFLIISQGAIIDATAIHSGPAVEIICSGRSPAKPKGCFYFHQEGTLFANANTPDWAVRFGLDDFSDAHNSAKIDHLIVNNNSAASSGGAARLNYVLNSDMFIVADSAGGGAGLALDQVQFSRISGAASATAGTGLSIENGYSFANTVQAIDIEVAELCLAITSPKATHNTFVSPYFNCKQAISSVNGSDNVLMNPMFGGAVAAASTQWTGITVSP
jgi:hypothetical protein